MGNNAGLAANLVQFIKELRNIRPDFLITQPVFGYPQILSESLVVTSSWTVNGVSNHLADAVGIMTYSGATSLQYVKNYDGSGCSSSWCALCDAAKI